MSRELAADPIQNHDDDSNDDFKFQSARTTRSTASAIINNNKKAPSSVSVNKRMLSNKSNSSSSSTTTPTRRSSTGRRQSGSGGSVRKAPLTASMRAKAPPVKFDDDNDNDNDSNEKNDTNSDVEKWNVRGNKRAAPPIAGSKSKSKSRAPSRVSSNTSVKPVSFEDNDSDSSSGVITVSSRRGNSNNNNSNSNSKNISKNISNDSQPKKRSASSLFESPITPLTKRKAASAAESKLSGQENDDHDDDESGPLEVTAPIVDEGDDDDFMSARERRDSAGGAKKPLKKKAAAPTTAKSPKSKEHIKAAEKLRMENPHLCDARVEGEDDDLLGDSLMSILAAAKKPTPAVASSRPKRNASTATANAAASATAAKAVTADAVTTTWSLKAPPTSVVEATKFLTDIDSPPVTASPIVARVSSPEQPQREPEAMPPFLPEFRNSIDVSVLLKSNASMSAIDSILSGETKCARMDAYAKGGRARSALAQQVATGYFTAANVEAMFDALQQRYKTEDNVARFSGELNVMRVIGDVLLPELAIELLRRACGNKITREEAIYFVEHPIISAAARAKALAEARGGQSRVASRRQK
jgi:hypothetical protein